MTIASPAPANWQKGSRALAARSSSRTVRRQNRSAMMAAKHEAEFLARHREDEVGMGVGNAVFDRARAGADAGKPPWAKAFSARPA